MKRIIRNPIFTFIVGLIIASSVAGVLAYTYQANDISYTNSKNSNVQNVEQAINDLYTTMYSKLPYKVEYYVGNSYYDKSVHFYDESSNLISTIPENTKSNCVYYGWSTTNGGSKVYDIGQTVNNIAQPGETIRLYAVEGFVGTVSGGNFKAHYTNGSMDECYYYNGVKCTSLSMCLSGNSQYLDQYCNSSLGHNRIYGYSFGATKSC